MRRLVKTKQLNMRLTAEQLAKLRRAAAIESRRRGELVEPGTMLRELGIAAVDAILARQTGEAA